LTLGTAIVSSAALDSVRSMVNPCLRTPISEEAAFGRMSWTTRPETLRYLKDSTEPCTRCSRHYLRSLRHRAGQRLFPAAEKSSRQGDPLEHPVQLKVVWSFLEFAPAVGGSEGSHRRCWDPDLSACWPRQGQAKWAHSEL
jgi:hypothetical protein